MKYRFLIFLSVFSLSLKAQDTAIIKPKVTKIITNHPAQYQYTRVASDYIEDIALGIDYQEESFTEAFDWDKSTIYQNNGGFNIYFISGNRINKLTRFGSGSWGGGFSMNFYGDSKYHNVAINTVNKDSAKTRISLVSPELYVMGRYEYKLGNIYPFFGIRAGAKWFSTSQNTETLMPLVDYENSTSTNLTSSGSMYVATEIGLKIRLGKTVSFVTSYGFARGTSVNLVDFDNTTFNSWQFDLNKKEASMNVNQLKFGFLFDLSQGHSDKKLIKEAFTDTTMYTENSNQPCPCCDKCKQTNSSDNYQNYPQYERERYNPSPSYRNGSSTPIFNGSGNGSSKPSRKSMPSISPGPSIPAKPKS